MIMGESKNPSSKDLLKLANHFGLKSGKEIIDEVLDTAKKWKSIANDSNLSKSTITMIEKKINEFK
jgi:serine/threonine-protein kinase HipA